MASRRFLAFIVLGAFSSLGASYRTTNFVVEAPTAHIAQQIGQAAEQYRKSKAVEWLGQEMPNWPEPCPVRVKVTMGGAGGATSFAFDSGRVLSQHMNIEGSLDRLIASVLPHEVTHTVFAQYFRCPVPRWADEGGSVLSEDDIERNRHDQLVRKILNDGRAFPLRRLFALREYPSDVMTLYAQGYSVTQFLVDASNRPTFLAFVAQGMNQRAGGWDQAARSYYRYNSLEELEQAWLTNLRNSRRPAGQLARNTATEGGTGARLIQTIPPTGPGSGAPAPVVRGQSPEDERYANRTSPNLIAPRPGYLPESAPNGGSMPPRVGPSQQDAWQPAGVQPTQHPAVQLGAPQYGTPTRPAPISPIGYSN